MGTFSRNLNKGDHSLATDKRPNSEERWTLLFIGKHGRTITLKRFKGLVLLTCLVLVISIAIAVGLLFLSLSTRHERDQLESDVQGLKAQIKSLRYEKDVLMTKLVLAESRQKPGTTKPPVKLSDSSTPQQDVSTGQGAGQSEQFAKRPAKTAESNPAESTAADSRSTKGVSVAIDNFKVFSQADENLLRVRFKLKNTSPNSQRVAGHAFVVLKGPQLRQDRWLTIPATALEKGKPTGRQRGQTFAINNFKKMRFKADLPRSPEIYQKAVVFIFTGKGDLLLEQNFPVKLPPAPPGTELTPPLRTSS
jgi:hypothetical protein